MSKWGVFAIAVLCSLCPGVASAQIYSPTSQVLWDMPQERSSGGQMSNITPAQAQAYLYRYIVDNQPATVFAGVTCAAPAVVTPQIQANCRAPFDAGLVKVFNAPGTHSITLQAFRADGTGGSGQSSPFSSTTPDQSKVGVPSITAVQP